MRISVKPDVLALAKGLTAADVRAKSDISRLKEIDYSIDERLFAAWDLIAQITKEQPTLGPDMVRNSKGSAHHTGDAIDIHLSPTGLAKLKKNFIQFLRHKELGIGGVGVYPWGVHIDTRQDWAKNTWLVKSGAITDKYLIRHWSKDGAPLWMQLDTQPEDPDGGILESTLDLFAPNKFKSYLKDLLTWVVIAGAVYFGFRFLLSYFLAFIDSKAKRYAAPSKRSYQKRRYY